MDGKENDIEENPCSYQELQMRNETVEKKFLVYDYIRLRLIPAHCRIAKKREEIVERGGGGFDNVERKKGVRHLSNNLLFLQISIFDKTFWVRDKTLEV